ncbi:MAG: hypothetical protein RI957_1406 [Verrucomicrobiota bacterium]|jgi:allophanate hydrolase
MSDAQQHALFRVVHPGPRTSLQDAGRPGLKGIGIPVGGAMDLGQLGRLNQLFDQEPTTAAYEMLWAGLQLHCLRDCWIAYGGAAAGFLDDKPVASERTLWVREGQTLRLQATAGGLWSYLCTAGGWQGESWFGSKSVWPDSGMGRLLQKDDLLRATRSEPWHPPAGVAARFRKPEDGPATPSIRVVKGPQWQDFPPTAINRFFHTTWQVSNQSNRAGYRLQGEILETPAHQLISEPTVLGSIQVPRDGQPIVLLNDGPTIGGYHKIAVIHPDDLDRFRQTPPGQHLSFSLIS